MGCGAPLRDPNGHVLAERGNVFDRSPLELYNFSPSSKVKEEDGKFLIDLSTYSNNKLTLMDTSSPPKFELDQFDNGMKFYDWSEREKKIREKFDNV